MVLPVNPLGPPFCLTVQLTLATIEETMDRCSPYMVFSGSLLLQR